MAENDNTHDEGDGRMPVPTLVAEMRIPYLGFCFTVMLSSTLFAHTSNSVTLFAAHAMLSTYATQAAVFVAFALLAPRLRTLRTKPSFAGAAAASATFGVVATSLSQVCDGSAPLFVIGIMLTAFGTAALQLCWLSLYAQLGAVLALTCYASSLALCAIIQWIVISTEWPVGTVVLALCPFASASALVSSRPLAPRPEEDEDASSHGAWSFPARPILLFSLFTFAFKLSLNLLPEAHKALSIAAGVLLGAAIMLAAIIVLKRKIDVRMLYHLSLPFAIAGLLCVMGEAYLPSEAGVLLIVIARELFTTFMVVMLCHMCFRNGIDAFWLFGLLFAASRIASLLANITSGLLYAEASASLTYLVFAAVTVALSGGFVLFVSDRNSETLWGLRRRGETNAAAASAADTDIALHKLSLACNLTRREEEVAGLRLQNATIPEVATRLFVSQATVKTHVNRIYRKTGARSIDELAQLIDQYR